MDKQIVFKSSAFGGFEKKAVLDYIYKLNEDTETLQAELRQQLDAATEERRNLTDHLNRSNERIKNLQQNLDNSNAELVGERARVSELGNMNEGLQEELERDRNRLRQREQELEKLIAEVRILKAKNDDFSAKQQEINESVSRIGQLMLTARSEADMMIKNAESESERLKKEAEAHADQLRREAEQQANATLHDADSRSHRILADAERRSSSLIASARQSVGGVSDRMSDLETEMDQVRSLISHLFTQLSNKAGEVDGAIDSATAVIFNALEKFETDTLPGEEIQEELETQEAAEASKEASDDSQPEDVPLSMAETGAVSGQGDSADSFFRGAAEA